MPSTIEGIISNLNTRDIVESIINAERFQVNHLMDRQSEATNQLTTYNAIAAQVLAMQSSIAPLLQSSTFSAAGLTVSDDTVLTAAATGTVSTGSYTLSVDALAANHQIASQGFADPTDTIGTGTVQIALGKGSAATITVDSSNNSLAGLKSAINDARLGITASIINDGTSANSYRLLLTSDKSGSDNTMTVTTSLNGGLTPDFGSSSFDSVEKAALAVGTSAISLGTGASYAGSANKTYSFTVAGSGSQTVGTDTITVNWTDGTNSGSIQVTTADTEIALTGTGADGLTLSFGAGTLVAGDTFNVQTFAPLVQSASDAQVSLGSAVGGGSPITITSASNHIENLIAGVTLDLKTITTAAVTITAALDKDGIKSKIQDMLAKYSDVMKAIDEQFSYDETTKKAGTLLGDSFLLTLQGGLRAPLGGALDDLSLSMKTLRSIGIQTADNGFMGLVNSATLFDKLDTDLAGVAALFTDSGTSDNPLISFLSAGTDAVESTTGYEVSITQAATRTTLHTTAVSDPDTVPLSVTASDNTFKLTVDGLESNDLTLTAKSYTSGSELAAEIQTKINADSIIGSRGLTVAWVDLGQTGYLEFTAGSYGSSGTIAVKAPDANSALGLLGMGSSGTMVAGNDVAGTINGEAATGSGQLLTGNVGNANTAGISLEVRLDQSQIVSGADATVTFNRGFASRLNRVADAVARSVDGSIARRTKGIEAEIEDLRKQVADQEERLAVRRDKLYQRFTALESALAQFKTQGDFLTQQLGQLNRNTRALTS